VADASDIQIVRNNTNESTADTYTDAYIGGLVDASDVTGATIAIWEQKVAKFSTMVDVTEAGATHKFSDLFDNAVKMLTLWRGGTGGVGAAASGSARVRVIDRVD
jgi:hypothetical protein